MNETVSQKKKRALKIIEILSKEYPEAGCHLIYNNPFELLISTILAAQCTDERVNKVMVPLYRKYKTPADIASADPSVLEKELSSINFYRNKTKAVIACSKKLVENFRGRVPNTIEELISLPGVGRKTANVVLGNCFNIPAIMTDTHLNRVSQRLNLVDSDKPDIIEMQLKEIIPAELQTKYSHIVGEHGRLICKARSPVCNECVVNLFCPSKGVFT